MTQVAFSLWVYVLVRHDSFHVPGVWKNLYVHWTQTSQVFDIPKQRKGYQRSDPAKVPDRSTDQQNGRDRTFEDVILIVVITPSYIEASWDMICEVDHR